MDFKVEKNVMEIDHYLKELNWKKSWEKKMSKSGQKNGFKAQETTYWQKGQKALGSQGSEAKN